MRERRSVNSQEARSIIASARRELRISCSIVSSSTRLSLLLPEAPWIGSSPSRVCVTVPVLSAARRSVAMPSCQIGKAPCSTGMSSRRLSATAGSATAAARSRAPWSIAWTMTGIPPSSRSAYDRLAC